MQEFAVGWDILHRSAVMCEADVTFAVHDTAQRHAPQLEQIYFLPIHSRNSVICIGQTNEGNLFIPPILFESRRRIGSDRKDHCAAARELFVFVTQARQLRAAIRSHEAAQECQQDRLAFTEI